MTRYRTIVADPPWDHSDGTGVNFGEGRNITHLPYPTMSVDAIKTLPVRDLAAVDVSGQRRDKSIPRDGCVLYLWATTRYLEAAHGVARAWGFTPTAVLVWCKPERGWSVGGTWPSNVEFIVYARRGTPPNATGSAPSRWFTWPRGEHSSKPEAFLDMVESVSPGPYLELFARRNRFGWDTWGDESLPLADLAHPGVDTEA